MTRCNGCFAVVLALLTAFTLGLVAPIVWSRDAETSESFLTERNNESGQI